MHAKDRDHKAGWQEEHGDECEDADVLTLAHGCASFEDGRGIEELRRVNKAQKKDWVYPRHLVMLGFPLVLRYCL